MREDEYTEFKKTTGEINEGIVSISAILNKHQKGKLYFGLKNDGTPFPFKIVDSTVRDVSRKIYEGIKPQIIPTIKIENIGETEVIVVEFAGSDIPYSAFGKYYIRTADEDRELTPSELKRVMIGQEYEENWEDIETDQTINDVDEKTLKHFFASSIECNRMPESKYQKETLLEQLEVIRNGHLTNAGVVLFSKKKPITLKMAVFATEHKTTFLDIDQERGNIFQLADAAVAYIIKNIRWRVEMKGDGIHRKEIPEVPIDAIREAVINSFAHAKYGMPVQHEIDIFSDRIVITNPGSFANQFEPTDYAKMDIRSYLRNKKIAHVLYLCKDVESFGTGIKKIYSLCNADSVDVSYENEENSFSLIFSRIKKNTPPVTEEKSINSIENKEGKNESKEGKSRVEEKQSKVLIPEEEITLLSIIKDNPHATNEELAVKTKKSPRTISRLISHLKSKGLIERVGSNKTGHWKAK